MSVSEESAAAEYGVLTPEARNPKRTDVWLVAALAVGSIVFAVLYTASGYWPFASPLWLTCLLSVVIAIPLLWQRRWPSLIAWVIATIYVTAQILRMMEPSVSQIILFISIYAIGAWQRSRRGAFVSRLFLCIGIFIYVVVAAMVQFGDLGDMTLLQFAAATGVSFLINLAFFGGAWLFGNRAWNQRQLLAELQAANAEVRDQEQQLTRQAVDLERVRIARELHDGVAHHIAGVGIHAAAARRSLEKNPAKAKESLQVIESSTRETVDELRALVYTLRDSDAPVHGVPGEGTAPVAQIPQASAQGNPGLGDLPELIESARRFDQTVEYAAIGEPRPLTPITEMSIYRVIQESLTNCSRYAGTGAEVAVRLRYGSADLEVEVSDAGGGAARSGAHDDRPKEGLGLGIVGMRERMNALGGSLEAGPKSRGGWLVRARIPYPRSTVGPASSARPDTDVRVADIAESDAAERREATPDTPAHDDPAKASQ